MKLHGWCEECRRVRMVRVSGAAMARLAAGGTPVGVCDACEDAAEQERRRHDEQRRAQRGHTKWGRRP